MNDTSFDLIALLCYRLHHKDMENIVIDFIKEHLGIAFLLAVVVVVGFIYLIWWTCTIYQKIKKVETLPCDRYNDKLEKMSAISAKIEGLPCLEHGSKIDNQTEKHNNLEVSITQVNTSIIYMQKSIDSLTQSLQNNNKLILDPFTQTHSPLQITEQGREMIERVGILEMFENNWEKINLIIKDNCNSMNPYDIQQFLIEQAIVFPEKFLSLKELDKIKNDAYSKGISLTSYMKVIAVMSRDRYFEENEIDINDVDKYEGI